jgi:hypothetical protein
VSNSVTIWPSGTVNLQGGQVNTPLVQLKGGTIGGWGMLASPINISTNSQFNASDSNNTLFISGVITNITNTSLNKTGPGTLVIAGTQWQFGNPTFYAAAGVTQFNSDAGGPTGTTPNLSVHASNAGTVLNFGVSQHLHLLDVGTNTTIFLDTNGQRVIVTDALTIAGSSSNSPAGTINLHDNALVVHNGAPGLAAIRNAIAAGYSGGTWSAPGIVTDMGTTAGGKTAGLGYASGSDTNLVPGMMVNGAALSATDVVVLYTYAGDGNLDGAVNSHDFDILAANFGTASGATWTTGDWNYDGIVNSHDFDLLAANFGATGLSHAAAGEEFGAGTPSPVPIDRDILSHPRMVGEGSDVTNPGVAPEPASLLLLGLGGVVMLGRGRRRRMADGGRRM